MYLNFRNPEDIQPEKAMSIDHGKPRLKTAVLQGPPGAGKSCFIRHYAYKWSKPAEGEQTEEQKMWDLVVILHASTLRLSAEKSTKDQILDAIRQNLAGPDHEVDAIIKHLEKTKLDTKVLIIPDGMDECRNEVTMKMLRELVGLCHKNVLPFSVLATSRSGLCPIKQSDFERRMAIEGFTLEQGVQCVQNYYREIKNPHDVSIIEYISNSNGKLDHILNNPLRTHMLCVVTADGTLKLSKEHTLRLKELLSALEELIKCRQLEKGRKSAENLEEYSQENIDIQTTNFYRLSLYSLLNNIRTFDDHLLQMFEIHETNPYFSFMKRVQSTQLKFQKVMEWHFVHEIFHEYLASCAIQDLPEETLQYFLLHLCSHSKFRNTQRILFSTLGEDPEHVETLSGIIKATVLLQSHIKSHEYPQFITNLRENIASLKQNECPLRVLLPHQQDQGERETTSTSESWKSIKYNLTHETNNSVKRKIFIRLAAEDDLMSHVYSCLSEINEEMQQKVFDSSIGCLMPHTK